MQQSHRPLYQMWAEGIVNAASRRADAIIEPNVLFEDDLAPEAVAANLMELGERSDAVAIVTADHPLVSQAIDDLRARGVPVVAYVTDLSAASRAGFVGTDNWKAGRTAAWFISQTAERPGKVFPFIGSHRYQCQDISDASFRSYMREHAPDFQVSETLLTHEEPENAYGIVRRLINEESDLRGIFVNGGGISGVLRALRELPPESRRDVRIVSRDVGPEGRKGLSEGLITAALCHPVERMPEELIEVMLRLVERRETASIEQRIVPFEIVTPESIWT
jgi:LacI family transcriptional regulator